LNKPYKIDFGGLLWPKLSSSKLVFLQKLDLLCIIMRTYKTDTSKIKSKVKVTVSKTSSNSDTIVLTPITDQERSKYRVPTYGYILP
jgi:hypothetical protein